MDIFEFAGGEYVDALEGFEGIGGAELFEEPEDALGAGFFEPGGGVAVRVYWEQEIAYE